MRLLRREADGSFSFTDDREENAFNFKYAILSHTWFADEDEVNFEDMTKASAKSKLGYRKIQFCGDQAAKDGLDYFWVDTCCINKSSSAELQEAITSMFNWYLNAAVCYVYLADVSVSEEEANNQAPRYKWESAFRGSRWFTRGWTLQELIAPASVAFYSTQGIRLGDKSSLEHEIHEITGIPRGVLRGDALHTFSVIDRLSWAEKRQTKRQEDKAYSLLGIFNIFMPLMYGEGDHAMIRLREEIDRKIAKNAKLDHLLSTLPVAASAAFNSFENQHGPTCLEETRVELLHEITTWADGPDEKSILWLNGIAGTGKSTIARTVARTYHDRGNLGASYLFSRGGGDVGNADKLFTTIAWQIATKIPAARRYICEAIMENQEVAVQSLRDQWEQLILHPLSKLNVHSSLSIIVIVIDALDECDSDRDIRIILRLLSMANSLTNIRLRIFVTSRPEIPIRCGFQQIPESERQGFVLHDIEPDIVNRDLNLFFEHNFVAIREERGFDMDWPGGPIVKRLVEISCGLFIWASTACRFIRAGRRLAMRRIMVLIDGHSAEADPIKQLDEIYITVLKDSISGGYNEKEKQELYSTLREVLGSIILLFSPLTVRSLSNLIGLPSSHVNETLADLHTIFNIPNRKNRPVRLHHPTFREFLLDNNRCKDVNFWIDQKQAHKVLADSCVDLMSRMLKKNICSLKLPGTLTKDVDPKLIEKCIPPELQYACLYWVQHYRHSGIQLSDGDKAHIFFKKYYLFWLEAINLMGRSSEMSAIIRMYHCLLEVCTVILN